MSKCYAVFFLITSYENDFDILELGQLLDKEKSISCYPCLGFSHTKKEKNPSQQIATFFLWNAKLDFLAPLSPKMFFFFLGNFQNCFFPVKKSESCIVGWLALSFGGKLFSDFHVNSRIWGHDFFAKLKKSTRNCLRKKRKKTKKCTVFYSDGLDKFTHAILLGAN